MISPINFRASVGSISTDAPVKAEAEKTETVTAPIETAATFKGAEALAAYNKAFLAADSEAEPKTPAFRGEEEPVRDEVKEEEKTPAFRGEEKTVDETEEIPAEETEETEKTDEAEKEDIK